MIACIMHYLLCMLGLTPTTIYKVELHCGSNTESLIDRSGQKKSVFCESIYLFNYSEVFGMPELSIMHLSFCIMHQTMCIMHECPFFYEMFIYSQHSLDYENDFPYDGNANPSFLLHIFICMQVHFIMQLCNPCL